MSVSGTLHTPSSGRAREHCNVHAPRASRRFNVHCQATRRLQLLQLASGAALLAGVVLRLRGRGCRVKQARPDQWCTTVLIKFGLRNDKEDMSMFAQSG